MVRSRMPSASAVLTLIGTDELDQQDIIEKKPRLVSHKPPGYYATEEAKVLGTYP